MSLVSERLLKVCRMKYLGNCKIVLANLLDERAKKPKGLNFEI